MGAFFPFGTDIISVSNIEQGANPNEGSYSIDGYHMTLKFATGLEVTYSFFRDEDRLYIFDRDYHPKLMK